MQTRFASLSAIHPQEISEPALHFRRRLKSGQSREAADASLLALSLNHILCEDGGSGESFMTRTIEVAIPDELLQLIDQRARRAGIERDEYIRAVLSQDVASGPSMSDVLAPLREEAAASGISEEEIGELLAHARQDSQKLSRRQ